MSIQRIDKSTGDTSLIAGGTLYSDLPISTVIGLFTEQAPAGFLYCDGTAYSATDYPELWALLPSTVKDTTNNTFTIDLRESTLKGVGTTSKTVGAHNAIALGEFIDDRVQNFSLSGNVTYPGDNGGRFVFGRADIGTSVAALSQLSPNVRSGATTEVKSTGIRWYIKAKNCAVPADFISKVEEVVEFGEFEEINISSSSSAPTKISKSGMLTITLQTAVATTARVYVNGILVASSTQNGAAEQITTVTIPVTKGDSIYITDRQTTSGPCYLRPYNFN